MAAAGCAEGDIEPVVEGGRVALVVDGDTLRLLDGRRVRLVQIDSPEVVDECFGREAKHVLAELVPPGTRVELGDDPLLARSDRFGRRLRYVFVRGENVNVALVGRGAAAPYFFGGVRGRYAAELLEAADEARGARRGLWRACPQARLEPDRALDAGRG